MKWRPVGGRRGMAPFILNLRARHIEWSTSCCSHPLCQQLGIIASGTHWIREWMHFRTGLMFWGKTFAAARIRTLDHLAHTFSTILTTLLPHYKQTRCRNFCVTDSCKIHYYRPLSDEKLRFTKMKLSLCRPWRHIRESGGLVSVVLNLGTLPILCVRERAYETHSARGWLRQKSVLMSTEWGFKDNTSLCDIFARHLVHWRSTKYRVVS